MVVDELFEPEPGIHGKNPMDFRVFFGGGDVSKGSGPCLWISIFLCQFLCQHEKWIVIS